MGFSDLVEREIRKAQAEGPVDTRRGVGKPMTLDQGAATADGAGFRIMAEAVVALRREIEWRTRRERTAAPQVQNRDMSERVDLQLRLAVEDEARRRFQRV